MRDDIIGGLRNAVEKGEDLEKAIRSFINAGYKESEVRQAAKAINTSSMSYISSKQLEKPSAKTPEKPGKKIPFPNQKNLQKQKNPVNKKLLLIIILSVILVILILGLISSLLFKEQITNLIKNLF